ncbi:hypothetical protein COB52_02030 [Candidatus Kaiserbacteria bacterium]|nr:MAG: hypothetical protein COB52_02030 [Candidatus Kaiserbacteria bacterium]
MKTTLKRVLTDTNTKGYYLVSDVLAFFTILSITSLVLETVPSLSSYKVLFDTIEWVSVAVFTFEYIARIIVTRPVSSYIFSFFGLVDLIAIVPTYLGLGNLTFLKSARTIRLIRLLRMVRLAKMKRLSVRDVEEKMSFFAVNVAIFIAVLVSSMLLIGTLIYIFEDTTFTSIPYGMLWSFKIFLIGIPIEYPSTALGQAVHMFGRLVGLIVFGVLIGVVGNIFKDLLFSGKDKTALPTGEVTSND